MCDLSKPNPTTQYLEMNLEKVVSGMDAFISREARSMKRIPLKKSKVFEVHNSLILIIQHRQIYLVYHNQLETQAIIIVSYPEDSYP